MEATAYDSGYQALESSSQTVQELLWPFLDSFDGLSGKNNECYSDLFNQTCSITHHVGRTQHFENLSDSLIPVDAINVLGQLLLRVESFDEDKLIECETSICDRSQLREEWVDYIH